jgi:glycosyltransferase involved in cell wall biosynthesis
MEQRKVALIIPAWNEAGSIAAVLHEVPPAAVRRVYVVSGDSTDETPAIATALGAIALPQDQPGYGAACAAGVRAAQAWGAEYLAFLDGDFADPPGRLPDLLAPLLADQADLVLGVRSFARHPGALPIHARAGNQLIAGLLSLLLGRRVRDLPSFKAIRATSLERLQMREMTYGWTTEMIVKAIRAGLRMQEVVVDYRPRLAGQSKVSGSVPGSLGAASKLLSSGVAYARWRPQPETSAPVLAGR